MRKKDHQNIAVLTKKQNIALCDLVFYDHINTTVELEYIFCFDIFYEFFPFNLNFLYGHVPIMGQKKTCVILLRPTPSRA